MKIDRSNFPSTDQALASDLILHERGSWYIFNPLVFSDLTDKQKILKNTAFAIDSLAKNGLNRAVRMQEKAMSSELFPLSSAIDSLVDRWMQRFNFSAQRLKDSDFTKANFEAFFDSLERQSTDIIGQWNHQSPAQIDLEIRKLLDAVFYFGEALFLKNHLSSWGKRLLTLQTTISRWPAHFASCQQLEFNPQEVRSLDWLATVCAYILSDYMNVEQQVEFEIFIAALDKSITYQVVQRFDLVGELWAFGLSPKDEKAPPIVLIRGTQKNPLKEGFWGSWWLNANPDFPGASICTSQYRSPGHQKLIEWMRVEYAKTSQKFLLAGHSIGGAIAVGLSINEHQIVKKAVVFNAPIYREMAIPYRQLIDAPEILQFQNCHDPICQLQTTDLGQIYHLDCSQDKDTRVKASSYFDSIAELLPDELKVQPSKFLQCSMQIAECAYRVLQNFVDLAFVRACLLIEPLPTVGDFARKLFYFPNSIHRYHSLPSSLHNSCLVLKCTPADLNRTELITLRLVFQWMCRTWGFLAVSSALALRKICSNISPKVCGDIKVLVNRFFRPFPAF